ncbi:MAG: hypothetical protein J1F27_07260, partial [Prevotellaceae bacterium]|nr:hypothetical protein [Prevotellaceae bacterium]
MKKKRTLLATLVLSGLMSMPALADGVMSLQGIGSEGVTAPVEGKYYVIQGHSQHSTITWLYDNGEGLTATEAAEPGEGPESMKYVWTFESSDEGYYAAKNLTTGRYIHIAGTGSGGAVEMQNAPSYFTISVGNDEDPNVVALKKNGYDQWIDMGYTGMAPETWSGGVGGSRRMYIYEAEVGFIGELE